MNIFYIILLIAIPVAILTIAYFLKISNRKKNVRKNFPVVLPASFPFEYPNGNGKPFIQSVVAVPDAAIESCAEGLRQLLQSTAHLNWQNLRNAEDFSIAFINPTATNQDGSPALMVNGIQSAGTVIGVANDGHHPPVIILPHQSTTNWRFLAYLTASVRHEGEHAAEWVNDQAAFWRFVGTGDIHPHFPDPI